MSGKWKLDLVDFFGGQIYYFFFFKIQSLHVYTIIRYHGTVIRPTHLLTHRKPGHTLSDICSFLFRNLKHCAACACFIRRLKCNGSLSWDSSVVSINVCGRTISNRRRKLCLDSLKRILNSSFVKNYPWAHNFTVTVEDFIDVSLSDDSSEQWALPPRVFPMISSLLDLSRALAASTVMHDRQPERERERERAGWGVYSNEQVRRRLIDARVHIPNITQKACEPDCFTAQALLLGLGMVGWARKCSFFRIAVLFTISCAFRATAPVFWRFMTNCKR